MDKLLIRGPVKLRGKVRISGAKNAALPCIAASILTEKPVKLLNVPDVADVNSTIELMKYMGGSCLFDREKNHLTIETGRLS
ncbi:MAG: UDP-N-acetylglucosamine 1-carboxyvinyltransferase, partial [Deltaproteobacteria bacterium]|nr:UDP-N-acetylglucosamine 1-carboxyvinyltransferase [Deltaproteobacteria bacterium]